MVGHNDNTIGEFDSTICHACHIKDGEDYRRDEIKAQLKVGYIRRNE